MSWRLIHGEHGGAQRDYVDFKRRQYGNRLLAGCKVLLDWTRTRRIVLRAVNIDSASQCYETHRIDMQVGC